MSAADRTTRSIHRISTGHPVDVVSGVLFTSCEDWTIPGRVDLEWTRIYSTALLKRPRSILGPGWTASLLSTLRAEGSEFTFVGPEGEEDVFENFEDALEQVETIRNLGSFQELAREDDRYIVTRWSPDSFGITRFVFSSGVPGREWPLRAIEDVTRQGIDLTYDEQGRLASVRQRREGRGFIFSYGARGRLEAVELLLAGGATGRVVTRYEYDGDGRLAAAIDAAGFADRYFYDAEGRMVREVRRNAGNYRFEFDKEGRCIETTGQDDYDRRELRYLDDQFTTQVTDSYGSVWRYHWNVNGQVERVVSPLQAATATQFDAYGRIVRITDAIGRSASFEYDALGNCSAVVDSRGTAQRIEFDRNRQPLIQIDEGGHPWRRSYDAQGNPATDEDPAGNRWTYVHDERGDLVEVCNPLGARKQIRWNAQGDVIEESDWEGNLSRFEWDDEGRLVACIDALGYETRFAYDARNDIIRAAYPDGASLRFAYDAAGNPVEVIDAAGQVTRMRYGPCGMFLEQINPDGSRSRHVWGTEPGRLLERHNELGEVERFEYDAAGNLVGFTAADGKRIDLLLDAAGDCIAIRHADGRLTHLERNAAGEVIRAASSDGTVITDAYDDRGMLVQTAGPGGTVTFERDALGRVVTERQGKFELSHEYDAAGNRIRTKSSSGWSVEWRYDRNGLPVELRSGDTVVRFERDALGREVRRALPGGAEIRSEYDAMDRLLYRSANIAALDGGALFSERRYSYDVAGRLVTLNDRRWGRTTYSYDACERLIRAAAEGAWGESFAYDAAGNVQTISRTASGTSELLRCSYEPGGRLLEMGDTAFQYDEEGRLIEAARRRGVLAEARTYSWSCADELMSVRLEDGRELRFSYDALGRRWTEQSDNIEREWHWDGWQLAEFRENGKSPVRYVFDPETFEPVLRLEGANSYAYLTDHIGTPYELIDRHGRVAWSARLSAWGEPTELASEASERLRFAGQFADPETGLHYNGFRYYDPRTGRYISQDPLGPGGDVNPYAYTYNPVNWTDPLGLLPCLGAIRNRISQVVKSIHGFANLVRNRISRVLARVYQTGTQTLARMRQLGSRVLGRIHQVGYLPFINPRAIIRALRGQKADRLFGLARFQRGGKMFGLFDAPTRMDYNKGGYGAHKVPHWHLGGDPPGAHRVPWFLQRRLAKRGIYPYRSYIHGGSSGIDPSVDPHAHP